MMKKPKRDTRGSANLDAVNGKEGAWLVFDLLKGLAWAANLKKELAVDEEIAALGVGSLPHNLDLVVEECFAQSPLVRLAAQNIHEI